MISPRLIFVQKAFLGGAYFRRGLLFVGLTIETVNSNSAWVYIMKGLLSEGFLRLRFGGLIFGRAYFREGLLSDFYGSRCSIKKCYNRCRRQINTEICHFSSSEDCFSILDCASKTHYTLSSQQTPSNKQIGHLNQSFFDFNGGFAIISWFYPQH